MNGEGCVHVTTKEGEGRARQPAAWARHVEEKRERAKRQPQPRSDEGERRDEEKNLPLAGEEPGAGELAPQEGADFFPFTSR